MADESALCAEYLYGKLNGSAALLTALGAARIYDTDVPSTPLTGSLFPCVVYHQQGSSDTYGVGAVRIFVRPIWTVKVIVDNQTFKQASAIYKLVDAALQNTSGTVTDGSVYACYRDMQIRFSENKTGGGWFRHVGGLYRLEVRATTTP